VAAFVACATPVANAAAPVCDPLHLGSVAAGGSGGGQLICDDGDGDPLSFTIKTDPVHGQALVDGAGYVTYYAPAPGYAGPDGFVVTVDDQQGSSIDVNVSVSVTSNPPVCEAASLSVQSDAPGEVQLSCSDLDGDDLTLEIVEPPAHGSLTGIDPLTKRVTYTPSSKYRGPDSFSYRASDGAMTSPAKTVSIAVMNRAPAASFTIGPEAPTTGAPVTFTSTSSDPETDVAHAWDTNNDGKFDDGTGPTATRSFADPGVYTVRLRVTDTDGAEATVSRDVTVVRSTAPGDGGGAAGGGGTDGPGAGGVLPARITIAKIPRVRLRALLAHGLKISLACDRSCNTRITLSVDRTTAKRLKLARKPHGAVIVASASRSVNGRAIVLLRLTSKARRALRKARSVTFALRVSGTGADRAAVPVVRTLSVRR
jgi:PKD repeat protein